MRRPLPEHSSYIDSYYGYVFTKLLGRWVREHILVWNVLHGEVPKGHVIHHKDGDKTNNAPCNLQVVTRAEHARLHGVGAKRSERTKALMSEKAKERNSKPEYKKMISDRAVRQHQEGNLGQQTWTDTSRAAVSEKAKMRGAPLKAIAARRKQEKN